MTSVRAAALAAGLLALAAELVEARADDNHQQNYLIGERAAGLGGAYTALSDDSSGVYYNPAGLAEAVHSSLSLSASVYGLATQSYEVYAAGFSSQNSNFVSYPTTTAWIQRVRRGGDDGVGRVQLALALLTPQSEVSRSRISLSGTGPGTSSGHTAALQSLSTQIVEDDTLWVGLAAAWKVVRRLGLGLSVFMTYRSGLYKVQSLLVRSELDGGGVELSRYGQASQVDVKLRHFGLLGVIGIVVPATEWLRFGAAFRSPSIELSGKADFHSFSTPADGASKVFTLTTVDLEGVAFRDRQPFKATLGVAVGRRSRWGASVDVSLYGPVAEYAIFESAAEPTLADEARMKKKIVVQVNAGGEYSIAGTFPLRLGFFTNRSSLASMTDCSSGTCTERSNLLTDGVDLYGFSGSVGYEIEKATLNLGWSYCLGWRTQTTDAGYDLRTFRSYLFISLGGSFRF
jgi:hypothetical protein